MKRYGLRSLITGALMAALIAIATLFIKVPMPFSAQGGYIHAGDGIIYLAALLLPSPFAAAAAAIGACIADIAGGYAVWAPWTAGIKIIMSLLVWYVCAGGSKVSLPRLTFAAIAAGVANIAGYYIAEWAIYGSFLAPAASVLPNLAQSLGGALILFLLGPIIITIKSAGGKRD